MKTNDRLSYEIYYFEINSFRGDLGVGLLDLQLYLRAAVHARHSDRLAPHCWPLETAVCTYLVYNNKVTYGIANLSRFYILREFRLPFAILNIYLPDQGLFYLVFMPTQTQQVFHNYFHQNNKELPRSQGYWDHPKSCTHNSDYINHV